MNPSSGVSGPRRTLLAGLLVLALLTACSSGGKKDGESKADDPVTTTTVEKSDDAGDGDEPSDGSEGDEGDGDIPASWDVRARNLPAQVGDVVEVECSPDGRPGPLWGTEIYTDDSSVCTAAVHVGLITLDDGGEVEIEYAGGEDQYPGSSANGIDSENWGSWGRSFFFPEAPPGSGDFAATAASWKADVRSFGLEIGDEAEFICSPDGEADSVWGTGPFTGDSSVCTAAVFAGLIDFEDGGRVGIRVIEGPNAYDEGTANDVTTLSYGSWSPAFEFTDG